MVLAASLRKASGEVQLNSVKPIRDEVDGFKTTRDCLNDDSGEPDDTPESPRRRLRRLCRGARNQCCSGAALEEPHSHHQGLALAVLAGLPPQYGLYTAFMGSFMYTIFGSCKDLTIGPTAIMSIMTGEYTHVGGPTFAIILTFLSGIIPDCHGLAQPSTQLKSLFGMKFEAEEFLDTMYQFFTHLHTIRLADSLLGVSCVILLLLIRHFKDRKFGPDSRLPPRAQKILEGIWWTFATARNAIAVLVCAVVAAILLNNNMQPFALTDEVKGGMPPFQVPNFTADIFDTSNNKTIHMNFVDIMRTLGAGIPIIALLSILESVAIAKAFAKGKSLDSTQEMLAIGICNLMGSFVSAYPGTGSFSRTAINNNSGVRTPMGGVFTGAIVIMALVFMAPYFKYIPKASLSAIIITAVIFMVHYQDVPAMWRTNRLDLLPFAATFIVSFVLGLEYGIIVGVKQTMSGIPYVLVSPDRTVLYPSSMYTTDKITKALPDTKDASPRFVVYDGVHINVVDYTTCIAFKSLSDNFAKQQATLIYVNLKPSVADALQGAGPVNFYSCKSDKELDSLISAACAHTNMALLSTCKPGDEDDYSADDDGNNSEQPCFWDGSPCREGVMPRAGHTCLKRWEHDKITACHSGKGHRQL
ncbi:hypothetical protein MRX96_034876 [Rhipicephalus microplus]